MFEPRLINWRIQYERMMRGFERLNQPYQSSVEYQDDLQHFLQDSWHLKDWIKNDPGSGIGAPIEKQAEGYPSLMIAADLANACKHFNHDKRDRTGAYATRNDVTIYVGQNRGIEVVYYITLGDGRVITAEQLIQDIISAWDELLRKLGLIS
jgi:hypothetical protein